MPLISSRPPSLAAYLREVVQRRELLLLLARRDYTLRFRSTAVGIAWLALRPALLLAALSFVFGRVSGLAAQTAAPYPLMVLAALAPWLFFAGALTEVANSVLANRHIVVKVYFPRLLLPLAALLVPLADLLVASGLLLALFAWYGYMPDWRLLALPPLLLLLLALTLGLGLWLAALNTLYRDVQHLLPFALMLGLYLSPVGYRFSQVPQSAQPLLNFNPMAGVLEGFRWALLRGEGGLHTNALAASVLIAAVALLSGLAAFRAAERRMADVL